MISLSFSDALAVRLTTASLVPVSCGLVSIAKTVLLRMVHRSFYGVAPALPGAADASETLRTLDSWAFCGSTMPKCSIRLARRPAPGRSTPGSSACERSRGRHRCRGRPVSGSRSPAARTSTWPSRTISRSIHAGTSRCRSTTSSGCVWTWRRGACVSRRRRRSPDGRAATCSIRSATRSSWTRSVPEFHFSPRPNRAGEIAWRPWGEAAFAEARSSDKPVLLAISAVWCHWCHVMDETSYSDGDVIRGVNERFVPIRVDNDERPDVNRRYNMGGWPTTAFLTPDGELLNGATYIPPDAMRHYVAEIADVWRDRRSELEPRLREMKEHEADAHAQKPGDLEP